MSEMIPTGSKYSDADRLNAIRMYAIEGTFTRTSKIVGIPERTLYEWGTTDWWQAELTKVRTIKQDEHINAYTSLVSDAIAHAHANLDQASPKDAITMAAIATDKARLLLNQPTSISSNSASVAELQRQFEALAANHRTIESSVVDDQ